MQTFMNESQPSASSVPSTSSLKRKSAAASTDSTDDLVPASKRARMECTNYGASDESESATSELTKKMDAAIEEQFEGSVVSNLFNLLVYTVLGRGKKPLFFSCKAETMHGL